MSLHLHRGLEKAGRSRRAHNPEIVGSNPASATKESGVARFISTNSDCGPFLGLGVYSEKWTKTGSHDRTNYEGDGAIKVKGTRDIGGPFFMLG